MHPDSLLAGVRASSTRGLSPLLDRAVTFERVPAAGPPAGYARSDLPTTEAAEAVLSALEDAEALLCASGMSALTVICLALLGPGRVLALPATAYYGDETLAEAVLEPWGVVLRRYDAEDPASLAAAADGAGLVLIETPTNPLFEVIDIAAAVESAHAAGALVAVDSTFSTPLIQRPLDLGADISWQSATKVLSGHSDVVAGVIATRDPALAERMRTVRTQVGLILTPDAAWLLHRGLRTLHLRVERQCQSALELARRLAAHPEVTRVRYPGLPGHPQHALAAKQMHGGFGGVLSFELADAAAAERVESALTMIHAATSLGSVESLIERRARIEPAGRVPEGLLRLSVGIEHVEDLWDDLAQALDRA